MIYINGAHKRKCSITEGEWSGGPSVGGGVRSGQ